MLIYRAMGRLDASDSARLADRLRAAGIRPTRGRTLVLEELAREPDDATAQAIHERLGRRRKRVGLATVYRALNDLTGAGVIDSLPHSADEACYRVCGQGHHHHLACSSCHRVVEVGNCRVGDWLQHVAAANGFAVTGHTLEVIGLCGSCRVST